MEQIRKTVQSKLNEIQNVDSGVPIPDGMVELGKTYFGYEIQEIYRDSDFNNRYTMMISLTGRLVRKERPDENTLQIIDEALENIKEKLKSLNFKYSYNDVSFQDGIRKIFVKATATYNEQNKTLII